ncbi:glyoxalase/bleomycin resistance protein/dioxygenase [Corynebacterium kutscheri]|uniref:Glyoxalase/bleomycin resistance protein/dioxygenase n=1 Tax=Corynebacterium kutscheri TaxID=35755 RepID=A0A0F6TCM1_9CORY|nr:VOC family protein [Corynebacterium kutscheri]AKE40929.1 lactoylglutathione lyase family protein [Corynebacterium kutscheri]VEH06747.1 glyoxalase/bleomycin resistance protein/dioxygenase [Corynebacterium kutscheri]VEH09228.1 glyoxalase/bleomycin resistance protein/dioxygenase [Corynebacterium kutscheri]VEH79314.1 glyoxalase/bleomycin resistance protein/dioxygenase [Corynebacterium kutscheri]
MRIYIASVFVDDLDHAHDFYTTTLGFTVKDDIRNGDFRWLTLTSGNDMELLLEPKGHPAAAPFTAALKTDGIPLTQFASDDITAEYEQLVAKGVEFSMPPTDVGPAIIAIFDDTCGNLIQIIQLKK